MPPPQPSSIQNRSMSKAGLKIALIHKRLAMLQDDHLPIPPLCLPSYSCLNATNTATQSTQLMIRGKTPSNLSVSGGSTSPVKDAIDESPSENIFHIPSANHRRSVSRKRSMVISDDEAEEDAPLQLLVQPAKKDRTKRKKGTSVDYLINETHNAFDNSRSRKIKIAKPSDGSSSSVMKRAEKVRTDLAAEYPSFVKMMLPSHVSRVFWLHLPTKFCKAHLPKCDSIVELLDEDGKITKCNYLAKKSGLSGGWRAFSLDHELNEGDVAVFQLTALTTFNVYIVRKGSLNNFDGAPGLRTLDDCRGQEISENEDNDLQRILPSEDSSPWNSASPSNSRDHLGPNILEGICFSDVAIEFEAVRGFNNFTIVFDGLVIDSKFSDANRKKYYELCCSQKSFLHDQLIKGLNCNLVIGIILEIINIADAIRACTSSTSIDDLRIWENTLKGFERLSMKVNFLQAKLNQMLGIASDLDMVDQSNGFEKCMAEQASAAEKMRAIESKLAQLKVVMEKMNLEMEAEMTASTQKVQSKLKEIANAPWETA